MTAITLYALLSHDDADAIKICKGIPRDIPLNSSLPNLFAWAENIGFLGQGLIAKLSCPSDEVEMKKLSGEAPTTWYCPRTDILKTNIAYFSPQEAVAALRRPKYHLE